MNDRAAKAREARAIKPRQTSVRARIRVPVDMVSQWEQQRPDDRGMTWAIGYLLTNPGASYIVGQDDVTVVMGQRSATGASQQEAIVELVKGLVDEYGYRLPQGDLDDRLTELGLLE